MSAAQEVGLSAQEQYDVASWGVGDSPKLFFAVLAIAEQRKNRIIQHKRPYREGAKLDDTGSEPIVWNVEIIFNNQITEEGLAQNGRDSFPDVYRLMKASSEVHETGDLVLPGIGAIRARFDSMSSSETHEETDTARCQCVWIQDNEESLDRALIRTTTARSTISRVAEQTRFTAQSLGAWDDDLNGLVEFAAELEALLLAPGRATQAVETQVRRNRRALQRIVDAQQQLAEDVGIETNQPRGSALERNNLLLRDRQAQAAGERSAGRPRVRAFKVDVELTNIFEVAARFKQDAEELLDLNDSRIADPFELRRGDVVLVYQQTTAR